MSEGPITYKSMRLERDGALARLTFIQPERGNPIDGTFCGEYEKVAQEIAGDASIRAVLVRSEGAVFSFGGDVRTFYQNLDELPALIEKWAFHLHNGIATLQQIDAPIVVAVHGLCVGGMGGIAASADIVVAEPGTKFVAAYAAIGFSNDAGTSIMYSRRMGSARTRRFLLMNETLDAEAALATGLVDEVVPTEALFDRAEEIARKLAAGPTKAFGQIRRLMVSVDDQPLQTQLDLEAQGLARIAGTTDAREGITAFYEKRKPVFQGE